MSGYESALLRELLLGGVVLAIGVGAPLLYTLWSGKGSPWCRRKARKA